MDGVICPLLDMASWVVLIWVVLSWIPTTEGHPLRSAKDLLDRLIKPVIQPIRSMLPPVRIGNVGVDLSPVVLFIGISILRRIVC
jgi:YggT family protein